MAIPWLMGVDACGGADEAMRGGAAVAAAAGGGVAAMPLTELLPAVSNAVPSTKYPTSAA